MLIANGIGSAAAELALQFWDEKSVCPNCGGKGTHDSGCPEDPFTCDQCGGLLTSFDGGLAGILPGHCATCDPDED